MFVARKLAKLRKEAAKQLRRAEKELSRHPQAMERGKLEEHLAHLREAMAGDDFDKILQHTRAVKHNIDQHVPIWRHSVVLEYTEAILVALVLAMFIRTFIVQAFKIPSGSMIPTLYVGDHILVNKFVFGLPIPFSDEKIDIFGKPQRGDVIVFKFPKDTSKDYIKRVIGLPGDTIEARGNELFINGEPVPKEKAGLYRYEDPARFNQTSELFIEDIGGNKHQVLYDKDTLRFGDTAKKVPPGHYFCMGDNRDHSNDSRYWGFVPFELIKGKAMVIYFSWPPGQLTRIGSLVR